MSSIIFLVTSYFSSCQVLLQQPDNLYAANGAAMVFAEKGQFDIAKDLFTQVSKAIYCRRKIYSRFKH